MTTPTGDLLTGRPFVGGPLHTYRRAEVVGLRVAPADEPDAAGEPDFVVVALGPNALEIRLPTIFGTVEEAEAYVTDDPDGFLS